MRVNGHIEFFRNQQARQYSGTISFKDPSGRKYAHKFRMDAEMYLGTPTHTDEALKTHHELQKIPDQLKILGEELKKIRLQTDNNTENKDL